jgi:hypothetical protein
MQSAFTGRALASLAGEYALGGTALLVVGRFATMKL